MDQRSANLYSHLYLYCIVFNCICIGIKEAQIYTLICICLPTCSPTNQSRGMSVMYPGPVMYGPGLRGVWGAKWAWCACASSLFSNTFQWRSQVSMNMQFYAVQSSLLCCKPKFCVISTVSTQCTVRLAAEGRRWERGCLLPALLLPDWSVLNPTSHFGATSWYFWAPFRYLLSMFLAPFWYLLSTFWAPFCSEQCGRVPTLLFCQTDSSHSFLRWRCIDDDYDTGLAFLPDLT